MPKEKPTRPRASGKGDVNIQVGSADNSQINAGYERMDVTFGQRIDSIFGRKAPARRDEAEGEDEGAGPSQVAQPSVDQIALFDQLRGQFNLEELETICWELGIPFDDLPAKGLTGKARQLVERAVTLNALDKLIAIVGRERPQADDPKR